MATLTLSLSACSGIPAKKDTLFSNYTKIIVKPINFKDTITSKINGDEVAEFEKAQPALIEVFKQEFVKNAKNTGYFEQVLIEGVPDSATLIVEPKITFLDPGIRALLAGTATAEYKVFDGASGKQIGKYNAIRLQPRQAWTSMMGSIETMVKDLGDDGGSRIGEAKP